MKVAISNIAWPAAQEREVADLLQRLGVRGVEVAPSKIGPKPAEIDDDTIRRYRDFWASRGIEVVAMQALLFGRNDFAIFGAEALRAELLAYLARIVRLGGMLGARALVFGSPKNRRVEGLTRSQIDAIALPFLDRKSVV